VWAVAPGEAYFGADMFSPGTLFHLQGATFLPELWESPSNPVSGVGGVWGSGRTMFAVGNDVVYERAAIAPTYPLSSSYQAGQIWGDADDDVWAMNDDQLLHFDGTWSSIDPGLGYPHVTSVWGSSPANVFVAGWNAVTWHWDGSIWTDMGVSDFNVALTSMWGTGPADVYAVGQDVVNHYDGTSWTESHPSPASILTGVWASAPDDVYVVGTEAGSGLMGLLLHFDGTTWSQQIFSDFVPLSIWGTAANDIYMGTADGVVHYDGTGWKPMAATGGGGIRVITGTGPDDVFALGDVGYHWDGTNWAPFDTGGEVVGAWASKRGLYVNRMGISDDALVFLRSCAAKETDCADRWDDDCDGLVNCADPDCDGSAACDAGGSCQTAGDLACNASVTDQNATGIARIDDYACGARADTGPEIAYRLTPATSGTVTVTLDGLAVDLDLDVLGGYAATGACDPAACVASSQQPGTTSESVTFDAIAGQTYYLVVDGYAGAEGSFRLSAMCN
jgi:hypothetical protein